MHTRLCAASFLILSLGLAATGRAADLRYTVVDLGLLEANGDMRAKGINKNGDVVGYGDVGGNEHAFLYSKGVLKNLGLMGGSVSRAYGISDAGLIGGDASTFWSSSKMAMLYAGGQMSAVVTFGGSASGISSMSANGTSTGGARPFGDGAYRAFIRYNDGSVGQIPFLTGTDTTNYGSSVSDNGYVVGTSTTAGGRSVAFIYGPFINPPLSMDTRASEDSYPAAINNGPDGSPTSVVGSAIFGGVEHAASFVTSTAPTDLGTFPGGGYSRALGVNDTGAIVGYALTMDNEQHAFIIPDPSSSTTMLDLNDYVPSDSGLTISEAAAINASGQIAVTARDMMNVDHALLLTPVGTPTPTPPPSAAPGISARKSLKTSNAALKIKGTASGSVTNVSYKIGGKKGTASGTLSWSFKAKNLKVGKNILTITAHGPGGDSAPLKITVIRQ